MEDLLGMGFTVLRLAALWSRFEPRPGVFDASSLDWQIEAAARAGRDVILALGPVKNVGYPEFYVPAHHLPGPLREGAIVTAASHPELAEAARTFLSRLVERYRGVSSITAWQVEQEAVDPLGMEHSWRLAADLVRAEVELVRSLDPGRPLLLNGFLPMSRPVEVQQRWRTRDQGDSLALAMGLGDIVGLDVYPCHALAGLAGLGVYLHAGEAAASRRLGAAFAAARGRDLRVMVTEGQAEPWEAMTDPPSPDGRVAASCPPERLIETYNLCLKAAEDARVSLEAYLFWGAEYWLRRRRAGDPSYVGAVERVLEAG
ncbi:MAG: beta-galactosidase [Candidatus Dormibacterales bacterium]